MYRNRPHSPIGQAKRTEQQTSWSGATKYGWRKRQTNKQTNKKVPTPKSQRSQPPHSKHRRTPKRCESFCRPEHLCGHGCLWTPPRTWILLSDEYVDTVHTSSAENPDEQTKAGAGFCCQTQLMFCKLMSKKIGGSSANLNLLSPRVDIL